jgi:predicted HTH transcriptional regulator
VWEASKEQVDLWRSLPRETQVLEFKEARRSFDNTDLYQYCVAIANEGGGYLIFGVTDSSPRPVVGTQAFLNTIKTAEQIFNTVGFRVDVCEVQHPDGRVVVMQIPGRPRGTAYNLRGQYWMRSGESLTPMTEDMLRAIFREGEPDWLEGHSHSGLTIDETIECLDVHAFFRLLELPFPSDRRGVMDRLLQEKLVDRVNGAYSIRRIAGILHANDLNDFPDLARKAPRVVVYRGLSKTDTLLDTSSNKGYAAGFQALVAFIVERLPQNEIIKHALRTTRLIPEVSIRELAANSLIHQDFSIRGTAAIFEIFENRIEFSNPGVPLFSVERFIDSNQSRNERLASMTRKLRICEEKGSGIDRVIQFAEMYQLPAPEFRVGHNTTVATIFGPRPFEEMDRQDRVRACYQHCVLKYVSGGRMTNQSLRERFQLPESKSSTISQIIAQTVDAELVKADDATASKKFAKYVPFWG